MASIFSNSVLNSPTPPVTGSPVPAAPSINMRELGDVVETRKRIYANALSAASTLKPLENKRHTLSLQGVSYADPDKRTIAEEKNAILNNQSLGRRLRGTWIMRDKATGDIVDKRTMTIGAVPHMTGRGTFINNGSEYTLNNQVRLKPGLFTRIKDNGEVETHANIMPGKGRAHRYFLDPEKGVYYLRIQQAKIPLMPLIRAMGASDKELREAWGNELYTANALQDKPSALAKLYTKVLRNASEMSAEEKKQALVAAFEKMEIDPKVTERTLKKPYTNLSKDAILDVTKRLLAVSRGEADVDDRDHLAYQRFYGPEDLIAERIARDHGGIQRQLFHKASFKKSLQSIPTGALTRQLDSTILRSGLGQALEEINNAEILDKQAKVTRMGEGGIPCHSADTEVFTRTGWKAWPAVTATDELACCINGSLEFNVAEKLYAEDYAGELLRGITRNMDYAVTSTHRLWVRPLSSSQFRFQTAADAHGKTLKHVTGGIPYCGGSSPATFEIPVPPVDGENNGSAISEPLVVQFKDWIQFLAAYLADGSTTYAPSRKEYRIEIAKRRSKNPKEYRIIRDILDSLGFTYRYEQDRRFIISGKHLASYTRQFGKAADKYVPAYVLSAASADRERFLELLTTFDCSGSTPKRRVYASASAQLRDDAGWLAIASGYSVMYTMYQKSGENPQHILIMRANAETGISLQKQRDQYQELAYDGLVYCAKVPGGLLLTRRNGKVMWSGNSTDSIPDEARSVQPSHLGFIDPLRTPESLRIGVDTFVARNAKKGDDGLLYGEFTDPKTGKTEYKSSEEIADKTIAFPRSELGDYTAAMQGGRMRYVHKNDVDFVLPHMENSMSPLGNLIPLKSASKGQRNMMGSRMLTQALPLLNPEAPLVQSGVPGEEDKSFEELYSSHMGAQRAAQAGVVTGVDKNNIAVKYADGTRENIELYHNFPYSRKTYLHQTPVVQPGQQFNKSDLLARSNFTDGKGTTALGVNARVAYIPWKGANFEDAIVISQSMANRLSSEHMYQTKVPLASETKLGKGPFISLFGKKFDKAQLDTIDDEGVVMPGTRVKKGDPLVLAANPRPVGHHKVHKKGSSSFTDSSEVWNHHEPGVVTDVVKGKHGVSVLVKATMPMQTGDKLCYSEDTEVLTERGWLPIAEVKLTDKVASLAAGDQLEYIEPSALHNYPHDGDMYSVQTTQVDLCVTEDHSLYAQPRCPANDKTYGLVKAKELLGKRYRLQNNANWSGRSPEAVSIPGPTVQYKGGAEYQLPDLQIPTRTFCALLGAVISEGYAINKKYKRKDDGWTRVVGIVQTKPHTVKRMMQELVPMLAEAGITSRYYKDRLLIDNANLAEYFSKFGYCHEKRIPSWVFDLAKEDLEVLYDWLMWGDGSQTQTGHVYTTTSPGLADDLQRLCLHVGMAAKVSSRLPQDGEIKGKPYHFRACFQVYIYRKKNNPTINHSHVKTQNSQIEQMTPYTGTVYCVTLPRNHVLYVRRNGKPVWCGNSGRFGGKGVVSEIIEDTKMPKDKEGAPYEILLNPLGVISRTNPSQVIEAALGKIAAKTGKPYKIQDFEDIEDLAAFALGELKKHGMNSRGDVVDPETGRKINDSSGRSPLTGNRFFMKLHHTAESKGQARSIGGYTQSGEPAKGGETGSKRLALLEANALLSHGATAILQDSALIRGQRNEDFWLSFMQGHTPAKPKVPMVFDKFVHELKAAGINVVPDGHKLNIMALTNKDVDTLAGNREIKSGDTVHFEKNMLPVPGGLFDPKLTGGHDGCFHPSVTVLTEHGPKPIGEIVNSRLACRVWTYNWTKLAFELKPVVNWFKNKSPEGIGRAVFQCKQPGRLSATARRYNPRTLWGTRGHQVYASNGCKQDLASAKKLLFVHEKLTYTQEQLVYGSLLGDGHVKETGQYSECHSSRQSGYLQLKYDILRPLCNQEPQAFTDTSAGLCREKVQFITVAHTAMHEARALCYDRRRKTLSDEWLSRVDDMGLAFFVFDDGHVCRRKDKNTVYICLSTHCFSKQEIEKLRAWLASRWGLATYASRENKKYGDRDCGWTIELAGDSALRLLEIIAPFAEDSVRYKFPPLPRTSRCGCGKEISRQRRMCNRCQLDKAKKCGGHKLPKDVRRLFGGTTAVRELLAANTVPADVLCPAVWHRIHASLGSAVAAMRTDTSLTYALREEPVKYRWQTGTRRWEQTETVYDIEVADNHNYVANGALVSNSRWSHIKLHEPMPNPVMEEPIRKLLGLTQKEFEGILSGKEELLGRKGPSAISYALGRINIPRELAAARMAVSSGKKTSRDKAVQKLGYLKAAARLGIHPKDWILDKVPVLPPRFRPISMIEESKLPLVADPNYLYKELIDANTNLKDLSPQLDDVTAERLALYQAFKAVTGLADPTHPKLVEKNVSGILKSIFGKSPKFGTVQRKLLSSTTDLVGRATVTPDASLDMDSIGLPEDRAWEVYKPFVIRRLRRAGNPLLVAAEKVKNKDPEARRHLVDELEARPVFVNRAPVLHRFGVLAFKPRLVRGETLRVSPLIVGGFNMDFDGDAVQYHVPAGRAAVEEALDRMLPSRSLLSPGDFKTPVHKPGQEYVGGLYEATRKVPGKGTVRKFMTEADAVKAYKRGDIAPYDLVEILK